MKYKKKRKPLHEITSDITEIDSIIPQVVETAEHEVIKTGKNKENDNLMGS